MQVNKNQNTFTLAMNQSEFLLATDALSELALVLKNGIHKKWAREFSDEFYQPACLEQLHGMLLAAKPFVGEMGSHDYLIENTKPSTEVVDIAQRRAKRHAKVAPKPVPGYEAISEEDDD